LEINSKAYSFQEIFDFEESPPDVIVFCLQNMGSSKALDQWNQILSMNFENMPQFSKIREMGNGYIGVHKYQKNMFGNLIFAKKSLKELINRVNSKSLLFTNLRFVLIL